jgi:hypothetical protein
MGHGLANRVTLVAWTNLPGAPDAALTAAAIELAVRALDQIYAVSPRPAPATPARVAGRPRRDRRGSAPNGRRVIVLKGTRP